MQRVSRAVDCNVVENPDQPAHQPVLLLALRVIYSALSSAGQKLWLALEVPLALFASGQYVKGKGSLS